LHLKRKREEWGKWVTEVWVGEKQEFHLPINRGKEEKKDNGKRKSGLRVRDEREWGDFPRRKKEE